MLPANREWADKFIHECYKKLTGMEGFDIRESPSDSRMCAISTKMSKGSGVVRSCEIKDGELVAAVLVLVMRGDGYVSGPDY